MARGGQRTTLEPSLILPSRAPRTFKGFEFFDTFFGCSGGRCCRSRGIAFCFCDCFW
ncbi:unnamed protein product [Prunus brigantina]